MSNNRLWAFALVLGVVCTASALVGVLVALSLQSAREPRYAHGPDGHAWLHEALDLTEEEEAHIRTFEEVYWTRRAALEEQFQQRIEELATAISEHEAYGPEVAAAVHELHIVHGRLQELAIRHYYQMRTVLPNDKQEQLRELAVRALSQPE